MSVYSIDQVIYSASGFLAKNRDTLSADIVLLLRSSENELVCKLVNNPLTKTGSLAQTKGKKTEPEQPGTCESSPQRPVNTLKYSLMDLLSKMVAGQPHFVRCIKPNNERQDHLFDREKVQDQLRYTGILETARIRREGYSHRILFANFNQRYHMLAFAVSEEPSVSPEACTAILEKLKLENWVMGKTKVFLKYYHVEQLNLMLSKTLNGIVKAQACIRCWLVAKSYRKTREKRTQSAVILQSVYRGYLARKKYKVMLAEKDAAKESENNEEKSPESPDEPEATLPGSGEESNEATTEEADTNTNPQSDLPSNPTEEEKPAEEEQMAEGNQNDGAEKQDEQGEEEKTGTDESSGTQEEPDQEKTADESSPNQEELEQERTEEEPSNTQEDPEQEKTAEESSNTQEDPEQEKTKEESRNTQEDPEQEKTKEEPNTNQEEPEQKKNEEEPSTNQEEPEQGKTEVEPSTNLEEPEQEKTEEEPSTNQEEPEQGKTEVEPGTNPEEPEQEKSEEEPSSIQEEPEKETFESTELTSEEKNRHEEGPDEEKKEEENTFESLSKHINSVSQDFLMLQQKLNQIIMAHQINPTSNGMFTRGQLLNISQGVDQQLPAPIAETQQTRLSRRDTRPKTSEDSTYYNDIQQSLQDDRRKSRKQSPKLLDDDDQYYQSLNDNKSTDKTPENPETAESEIPASNTPNSPEQNETSSEEIEEDNPYDYRKLLRKTSIRGRLMEQS
ncbi:Myosin-IIIa [Bagarius yarrelli]|uniref:non-specific serine/threonine protein kinase n=1 Tax=Bagarius yarrelli TaxID=175774 RepID=A0A556VV22_BAGYA|nr:Myosin-IIIa [Bagarius yarrelli]